MPGARCQVLGARCQVLGQRQSCWPSCSLVSEAWQMKIPRTGSVTFSFLTVLLFVSGGCSRKSSVVRPANVPSEATYVAGAKVGWWQQCEPATGGQPVHCRIWNGAGLNLVDEGFLPYDGGPPPKAEELKISSDPTFPGPDRICLSNGRVLLPQSRFDELKKFVDWLNGKRGQPR